MGKGDRRSRRGKIWRGTYGRWRPRIRKAQQQPEEQRRSRKMPKK